MKCPGLALALSAIVLFAAPPAVDAAPFTDVFDGLQTELERRRDEDFGGTLTRLQRRQRAAVTRSLALLDRDSPGLAVDIRLAQVVLPLIARVYRQELLEAECEDGDLCDLTDRVTLGLRDLVNADLRELEKQQSGLNAGAHRRVRRVIVAAADTQITSIFSGLGRRALLLERRVLGLVKRGARIAQNAAPGQGREGVRARVTRRNFEASSFAAEYDEGSGTLTITGTGSLGRGRRRLDASISITRTGVFAVGTFALTQGTTTVEFVEDGFSYMLNEDFGSLAVTELDTGTGRVAGVFDMGVTDDDTNFVVAVGEFTVNDAEITPQ